MARAVGPAPWPTAKPVLLLAPLLLPHVVPLQIMTPLLAYVVTRLQWLVALGAVSGLIALLLRQWKPGIGVWRRVEARAAGASPLAFWGSAWAISLVLVLVAIPDHRWTGASLGGDEPKYLRVVESLYHDLDADVGSQSLAGPTPAGLSRNLRSLSRSVTSALSSLAGTDGTPPDHRWNLGNWTLAGRHGGQYYLQSPGLPVLLLPAYALQRVFLPEHTTPPFLVAALALLWSIAFTQTALLAAEVSGSRVAGLLAAAAVAFSAPLLVGGYHFYPEVAAAAAVPWIVRFARTRGPDPGRLRSALLALTAGSLPWLHPKFVLLAAVCVGLLAAKARKDRLALALILGLSAVPVFLFLLFAHAVTGLFRPDAFYQRYGDELYSGPLALLSPEIVDGLVNGLFAARDGILVMAPVAAGGLLALPLLWRKEARTAVELFAVFASLWLAAALHQGGAAGPPGRLLAPVACLLAAPLAVGLVELHDRLSFRWTIVALAVITAAITLTMLRDFRRAVNPYRGMFVSREVNFAAHLPDGQGPPGGPRGPWRRFVGPARGLLLAAILAFWAWFFARSRTRPETTADEKWMRIRNVHLGWWATLAVASVGLRALAGWP